MIVFNALCLALVCLVLISLLVYAGVNMDKWTGSKYKKDSVGDPLHPEEDAKDPNIVEKIC